MKVTNKKGLPQALVDAVQRSHRGEAYTASSLTKTARQYWLTRRHEITRDVSDLIWQIFGTAVHSILEKADNENRLTEEYLSKDFNGKKLSGICDVYDNGIIQDWKTTSVWAYIFMDDAKMADYESQLNTYAYLYRSHGFPVNELQIVMLFRDWQASKAKYDSEYPQSQVEVVPVKLWSESKQLGYIVGSISYYESFRDVPDNDLPFCTPEQRWAKPGKWAVMKKGRKSAIKLHSDEIEAHEHADNLGTGHYVEERPGEQWKRCEYCDAREFCNQYKEGNSES